MNETAVGIHHNFWCTTNLNMHWRHSTWHVVVALSLGWGSPDVYCTQLIVYKLILYHYVVLFICEDLASFCHCVFRVINSYRHLFRNYWRCNCIL